MDVALLSETWLRDQKELLDYVSIDGYATEFGHRVATKGGGVGGYIKENVAYRRRFDIEKTQPDLEQLWMELPGRNKHSKLLLGVIYRSDLLMTAFYWLECFEDLLSHITSAWDGMVVRTGDINFDLIGRLDSLVTRDINTLDMFGLKQIVTKPTRVTRTSGTLIDHIITNYPCNGSFENEDRSTKHPKLENEAPKTRKRSTLDRKRRPQNLENEALKSRKRSTQNSKPLRV